MESPKIERHGSYYRTSDGRTVRRFLCQRCGRSFSMATGSPCFGQKRRDVNARLLGLLCSSVSMRRAARLLQIHRITVARKLRFLSQQARLHLDAEIEKWREIGELQFDELETMEHTKYKPLSVAIAVIPKRRKIVGFEVSGMPAKGPLAERARKRYGDRPDHRGKALGKLFERIHPLMKDHSILRSDSNPRYPHYVHRYFPHAQHDTVEGRRGCVTGQGELKEGRFDPLFDLNHTFAMLRANVSRLVRRTWCTTKKVQALADHLAIYADYHNRVLTPN